MSTLTYLDACPSCPPGIPDASPALGEPEQVHGGTVTDHQCGTCETAWSTEWRAGWPVDRLIAGELRSMSPRDGWPAARDSRTEAA